MLLVTVAGPRPGLASLCVGDGSRVRILHASAAVGDAVYVRDGIDWRLKSGFDWELRDSPGPTEEEVRNFLGRAGWVANAIRTGVGERRFMIRLTEQTRFLAITYLSTAEPMAVSYWPASVDDGCAAVKVAQGLLPETVRFQPERWHALTR